MYDFSDVEPQQSSDLIPDGTFAKVTMTIRPGGVDGQTEIDKGLLKASTTPGSDVLSLDCEFTVVRGRLVRRKFWQNFTVAGGRTYVQGLIDEKKNMDAGISSCAASEKHECWQSQLTIADTTWLPGDPLWITLQRHSSIIKNGTKLADYTLGFNYSKDGSSFAPIPLCADRPDLPDYGLGDIPVVFRPPDRVDSAELTNGLRDAFGDRIRAIHELPATPPAFADRGALDRLEPGLRKSVRDRILPPDGGLYRFQAEG